MFERLNVAIHQFAKRQMTYFRKMEKDWAGNTLARFFFEAEDSLLEEILKKYRSL